MNDRSFPEYIPQEVREYYDGPDLSEISGRDRACLQRLIEREPMLDVYKRLDSTFRDELDALGIGKDGQGHVDHP